MQSQKVKIISEVEFLLSISLQYYVYLKVPSTEIGTFLESKPLCVGSFSYANYDCQFCFGNVCSAEKDTKRSSNTLLRLVSFSAEQTLHWCITGKRL